MQKNYELLRRILGTAQIIEKLNTYINSRDETQNDSRLNNSHHLDILPGSIYAHFAIPLDYLPSRDYRPRWGYSREKIEVLSDWFDEYEDNYTNFLTLMFDQEIDSIAIEYNPENPKTPAFIGGAICAFDSLAIYTMLSVNEPKIFCEIGSGMTTLFAKQAILDKKLKTKVISIDPEPRQYVDDLCDQVIREPLENIDPK